MRFLFYWHADFSIYKTYATILKNEFNKNCQDLLINPAVVTIVVRVLRRDPRINDRFVVGL